MFQGAVSAIFELPVVFVSAMMLCSCGSQTEDPGGDRAGSKAEEEPRGTAREVERPAVETQPVDPVPTVLVADASAADASTAAAAVTTSPEDDPCSAPAPAKLKLRGRKKAVTPWGFTVRYLGGGHKILMSPSGGRGGDESFWELAVQVDGRSMQSRLKQGNWRRARNFRGFCWRGVGVPGWHAKSVVVEVAPNCDESGALVKKGCKGVFTKGK